MLPSEGISKTLGADRRATILVHRRINNLQSGSGVHLMCLCTCLADAGYDIRIVMAPVTSFGRIPFCRPDRILADRGITVEWPGTVRIGGIYFPTRLAVWIKALRRAAYQASSLPSRWFGGARQPYPSDLSKTLEPSEARTVQNVVNTCSNDIVVAEYSSLAPLLGGCEAKKRAVLMHDLFSSRAEAFQKAGRSPDHIPITLEQECERLMQADTCIHASQIEAEQLQQWLPQVNHIWMRPVIAENTGVAGDTPRVVFIGVSHGGNRAALDLILNEIWPRVRSEVACELWIVGEISDWVKDKPEDVRCLGFIEDLRELGNGNVIGIAPMLVASGISIKIGTYLELGMRVLTFKQTLEAYGDTLDGLVTAVSTTNEFVSTLVDMISDQGRTTECRQYVMSKLQTRMHNDELLTYLKVVD